jgi:hypothetical protein
MSHMPHWLAKTPEMIAMDRWFSVDDAGSPSALEARYLEAITRVRTTMNDVFTHDSKAMDQHLRPGQGSPGASYLHFDEDWMNLQNLSSGGNYWPQIPTWQIMIWMSQGIVSAARKALGVGHLTSSQAARLFANEIVTDPDDPREGVLPLVTCWICVTSPGGSGFEVDTVRGPTAVQMVISTPAPYAQSRIWNDVKPQIDAMWNRLHPDQGMPEPPPEDPLD